MRRRNCGTALLKTKNIPCAEAELKVTAYSLCGSGTVELQVTEHAMWGSGTSSHRIFQVWNIRLVPYARVRKTWERRAAGPWVKAILVVLLFTGVGTYWDFLFVFSVIIKQ